MRFAMQIRLTLFVLLITMRRNAVSILYLPVSKAQFQLSVALPLASHNVSFTQVAPARQDYYWDPKQSPDGLLLPCWENSYPDRVILREKPSPSSLRRSWFKISEDFIDMQRIKYTGLVVDPNSDALELSPFYAWTFEDAPQIFLCAAHGFVNKTTAVNFFELHFVRMPLNFVNQLNPDVPIITSIDVTFESYSFDPFPPGCSYKFEKPSELEKCIADLGSKPLMPEFQTKNIGIILDLETYIEETAIGLRRALLDGADAICARYECEVFLEDRFSARPCIIPKSYWTTGWRNRVECNKIAWVSSLADAKESRVTHNVHWIPRLKFKFKAQTVNCDVIRPLFDILIPRTQRKQPGADPSDWVFDTPFRAIMNHLDTVYWRSRALPHQAYYQPTACAEFRGDATSIRAFFKPRAALDVYNGFTVIFHLKFEDTQLHYNTLPTLLIWNMTIHLRNSDIDLLRLELHPYAKYWRLNVTFWLLPDRNGTTGIVHFPKDKDLKWENVYTGKRYNPKSVDTRTFVLLVDGPDFVVHSKLWNWEHRRMRLLQDGGVLAESRLYVPSRNYFKSFGRRPEANGRDTMPFIANSLEVSIVPMHVGSRPKSVTVTSKILNWPDYDFLSPVESRKSLAWELATKGCSQTEGQPLFPTPIWRTGPRLSLFTEIENRFYWSNNLRLCNGVCKPYEEYEREGTFEDKEFVCPAPDSLEPCSPDNYMTRTVVLDGFYHPEQRQTWNWGAARYDYYVENVWYSYRPCKYKRYLEAMRQFCGQNNDWDLYKSCSNLEIKEHMHFDQCTKTTFRDSSTGMTINCEENSKIFFLSHTCRFKPAPMMAGQSLARIQFRPVVGRCTRAGPRGVAVRLSEDWVNSTLRPQSTTRRCPPGQYIGKIPPIQCEVCPPNTFADPNTPDDICEVCPDTRPTTNGASESSSIQCSNGVIDLYRQVARRRLMGDKTEINYKDLKLELKRTLNLHQNLTVNQMSEYQIMAYLEPKRSLLNAQFDAETLFQEMTQITFSPGELFSMTIISLGLAVFFSALTFIIALGSRRGTLAAVDKSIIQKGLSRLWRHVSTAISVNLLWLRMHWRVYRDRRPTWQRRLSAAEAREDRNIFKMGSILRQKAEFEHMEELRTRLVNQVIQLSTEAARKAEIVRKQELQAQEQLLSEKDAQGEEVGLIEQPNIFRLGPLEADPLRLPPYQGPTSLEAYLFPPRREIPSFFFFRNNEFDEDGKGKTGSASEMEG